MKLFAELLALPFPTQDIEFRVGSTNKEKTKGLALAYITSRAVMERLDMVVGPGNWESNLSVIDKGFTCSLSIRVGQDWVTKMDAANLSDIESIKGGASDALKRAAVQWGIGRYLYGLPDIWVALENGKYIPDNELKKARSVVEEYTRKLSAIIPLPGDRIENLKKGLSEVGVPEPEKFIMDVFGTIKIDEISGRNILALAAHAKTFVVTENEKYRCRLYSSKGLPYEPVSGIEI